MDENKLTNFILKLWSILKDKSLSNIISWDSIGKSFHIIDIYGFCEIVLPRYFKHKNIASFVRQLNLYGFKKIAVIDRSAQTDAFADNMQFAHPYFIRDNPELISRIKRNCSAPKRTSQINLNNLDEISPTLNYSMFNNLDYNVEASTSSSISAVPAITGGGDRLVTENGGQMMLVPEDELNNIINELQTLRIGQSNLHNKVGDLSNENEMLWNEISVLRKICERQRQSVSKLVQFLLTFVQPTNVESHLQKHHRYNSNLTPKTKRIIPYIKSSNLSNNNTQLNNDFLHYNNNLDSDNKDIEMSVAALQQFSTIHTSQSLQSLAPNWEILTCLQKDVLSQSIDNSTNIIASSNTSNNQFNQALDRLSNNQQLRVVSSTKSLTTKPIVSTNSPIEQLQISLTPQKNFNEKNVVDRRQFNYSNLKTQPQINSYQRMLTNCNNNNNNFYNEYNNYNLNNNNNNNDTNIANKQVVKLENCTQSSSSIRLSDNQLGNYNSSINDVNSRNINSKLHLQTTNEFDEFKDSDSNLVVVLSPTNSEENNFEAGNFSNSSQISLCESYPNQQFLSTDSCDENNTKLTDASSSSSSNQYYDLRVSNLQKTSSFQLASTFKEDLSNTNQKLIKNEQRKSPLFLKKQICNNNKDIDCNSDTLTNLTDLSFNNNNNTNNKNNNSNNDNNDNGNGNRKYSIASRDDAFFFTQLNEKNLNNQINSTPAKRMRNSNYYEIEREENEFFNHQCCVDEDDDVEFYAEMKNAADVIEQNSVSLELDDFFLNKNII